ncbi:metallo-beta-lactamase superfamily protein [Tahibacter aquaticus]|uniref:Metallo-beta-lactamase superfamily protein n=1 Tax=Tahibacter aquaticus TaxID=520092 RepID=A0A4R6YW62_9GAMM|nr:N-acyl homoserine lactonase family protein [Tahibacter aquaticus]TDR43048.1 metallo-beta-lactamase superfamily protein [Tahibacter aquaticus]
MKPTPLLLSASLAAAHCFTQASQAASVPDNGNRAASQSTTVAATTGAAIAKLYALDCGRVEMADTGFLADDGSLKGVPGKSVVPCFVIRHPRGDLIWDTGLPDETAKKTPEPDAAFRFSLKQTLGETLKTIGLTPSSFKYVSFSHLHFDHAGNGNLFAGATWIVDRQELQNAFSVTAKERGESPHYDKLKAARKIVIGDNSPYDVFGDGSVVIHRAPGHTAGHSMLLVRTARSGAVLLTGDLWILKESQERRLVPIYNSSREQTLQSMAYAEALAQKTGATIVRQHVPEDFDTLPVFPAALE